MAIYLVETDEPIFSLKEALKENPIEFETPVEALEYVRKKKLKAVAVDNNCNGYYTASQLGIELDAPPKNSKSNSKPKDDK